MSIETYVSWTNDVPRYIELIEKAKGIIKVPFNPDTNEQFVVHFTKESFIPESIVEDKSVFPENFNDYMKHNLILAAKTELIKLNRTVLMDDIDFVWSDKECIMAVRIKLNSHKSMIVPVMHKDKFINNAIVRTYIRCNEI